MYVEVFYQVNLAIRSDIMKAFSFICRVNGYLGFGPSIAVSDSFNIPIMIDITILGHDA